MRVERSDASIKSMGVARADTVPETVALLGADRVGMGARVALVAALLVWTAALGGCATTRVHPALYEAKTFALVSVHARRSIYFHNVAVAPMFADNELGHEALEMELGETEGRLGEIFGVELLPAGKAIESRAYDALPEVVPAADWTQLNHMTAVDLELPETVPALADLARALGVDAVIVLRHEWSLARDTLEVSEGITAFDRCVLLVVAADGKKLWHDVVVGRVPVHQLGLGPSAFAVGMNGGTWADEARQLARRTAREAMELLERRYREGRTAAASAREPS